ncbi:CPBP family intramembrane glutamic endopeptidase [Oerskovia jenensis]|uniref:Membrane protease YdiL (CAAX protease family) n=1 Tax=Oerskovia jenensis TaxID=162169 RepID=A0ABS2LKI1_9CELL|nr:CPBP family intramembrane glutamic endopeptidase [Oerskovia jenensis]MBM7480926.1 membrane protease YdiL (CAAX protease family) [Oerskovia jenensis]
MILAERTVARRPVTGREGAQSPTSVDEQLLTDPCTRSAPGIARTYGRWAAPHRAAVLRPWSLPELAGVAVLEEVLYRGVVVFAALALDDPASSIGLVLTSAVLFGLSHDTFGTRHVVLKCVHAGALSISVLAAGTLLPAVVAHLTLNACSWVEARRWTRAAALSGRGA